MFTSLVQAWFELGIAVSGVVGGLITGVVYSRARVRKEQMKEMEEASIGPRESAYQAKHSIIHETLTDLRIKAKADRARIGHFHNGGKFLDGTPMKKFSITHESCERGVSYDGGNLQNILVTMFWNLIQIMRDNEPKIHTTVNMPDGYFRSYNMSNGIDSYAILPIMKQELYIGFIELEWFDSDHVPTGDELRMMTHQFEQSRDYIELELALR